jgi:hypothetical protein
MTTEERLRTIAENEQKVYKAGKRDLMAAVQNYGARTYFRYGFAYWHSDAIYPVYDIAPVGDCAQMLAYVAGTFDLAARLNECRVKLDTRNCTNLTYAFTGGTITHVPEIDTRGLSNVHSVFISCTALITIDNIILKDDGSQTFQSVFDYSRSIENLKITGVIGQNGFNVQHAAMLSRASIESIINALSSTATGLTVTLSKTAVNKAFATSEGANDGATSAEWLTLIGTRSNWTISLV